jgi:hypothetical protein
MNSTRRIFFSFSIFAIQSGANACDLTKAITTLRTILNENQFVTDRNISSYAAAFGEDFLEKLQTLNHRHTWLDFGTGQGFALNDYAQPVDTAHATAEGLLWHFEDHPRLRIMLSFSPSARRARTIGFVYKREIKDLEKETMTASIKYPWPVSKNFRPPEIIEDNVESVQFRNYKIQKAHLITDYNGAFSYSLNPLLVLRSALRILSDDGEMYFNIPGSNFVINKNGRKISLRQWLQDFNEFQLTLIKKPAIWKLTRRASARFLKTGKSIDKIDLKLVDLLPGSTPIRTFEEIQSL